TQERQERTMPASTKSSDAFLGAVNNVDSKAVAYALAEADHKSYVVFETTDFSDLVAQMLASGSAVCLYQQRAEFGPERSDRGAYLRIGGGPMRSRDSIR